MKIRDYRKHTYTVCKAWAANKTPRNAERLCNCLRRWVLADDAESEDYGYDVHGDKLAFLVDYCSDRMNAGRAKAILRLVNQEREKE